MAEATLTDVRNTLLGLNEEQGRTTEVVSSLVDRFQDMLDFQKRAKLDDAEARREAANKSARLNATDTPAAGDGFVAGFKEGLFDISGFGVLDILGVGALVTQITGFFAATAKIVKDLAKVFSKGLLLALEGTFKGISAGLRVIENAAFKLRKIPGMGAIANLLARLTLFFEDLGVRVGRISEKIMPKIRFFKGIGRVFGKLFLPLTIFITAWDTVKGAIEGFQDDGIIGGLQGAVDGFVNSLIGAPLDLIKDATAFVLGKLGFENAQKTLNSFSFQDVFSNLIGGIFEDVRTIGSFVGDLFKGEFSLERANEALGAIFSLSPVGRIMNLIQAIIPETFEKIGLAMDEFVKQLRVNAEISLRFITTQLQNIPDQLLKFLSDNLRIQIPRIAIPVPFSGGKELVIAEASEVGVPGGEGAARRIAERNARLQAQLLELSRQNLADVGGAAGTGTNIVVDNSTVAPSQTSVVNQLQFPGPLSESTERVTLSD